MALQQSVQNLDGRVCEYCQKLKRWQWVKHPRGPSFIEHHPTYRSLSQSAAIAKCSMCSWLRKCVLAYIQILPSDLLPVVDPVVDDDPEVKFFLLIFEKSWTAESNGFHFVRSSFDSVHSDGPLFYGNALFSGPMNVR